MRSVKTRRGRKRLFIATSLFMVDSVSLKRHAIVALRFMSKRPGHLISHEKLRVSVQLRARWRPVVSASHMRNVHSFITLFSNQEAPDASRSGHFPNDHVLTIRHIGTTLKPPSQFQPTILLDASGSSLFDFVSRSFHRSSSVSHYSSWIGKTRSTSRIFHDSNVSEYISTFMTDEFSLILPLPNSIVTEVGLFNTRHRFSNSN